MIRAKLLPERADEQQILKRIFLSRILARAGNELSSHCKLPISIGYLLILIILVSSAHACSIAPPGGKSWY